MKKLTHGELFAGIGGFGVGFDRAGMVTKWHVEIDRACQTVLRRHWPKALILDDVTKVGKHNLPYVDVISFGSPCQDLSVAGKRKGLVDGERSNLFFEAIRIVDELKPVIAIWENVPGAFSSNSGRDFAAVLGAFRDIGARDIAWRTLDAQHFGVPQRRRRIFLVADYGGERAGEILFEQQGRARDYPQSREAGKDSAAALGGDTESGGGLPQVVGSLSSDDGGQGFTTHQAVKSGMIIPSSETPWDGQGCRIHPADGLAPSLSTSDGKGGQRTPIVNTLKAGRGQGYPAGDGNGNGLVIGTLNASGAGMSRPAGQGNELDFIIPFQQNGQGAVNDLGEKNAALSANRSEKDTFITMAHGQANAEILVDQAPTLNLNHEQPLVAQAPMLDTFTNKGYNTGEGENQNASKNSDDTGKVLRVLREKVGEEAFAKWGLRILDSLQQEEILRPNVHGEEVRRQAQEGREVVGGAQASTTDMPSWSMRKMWVSKCKRRTSQEWGLARPESKELGAYLSQLSQHGTQQEKALYYMWQAAEGIRVLREALSTLQKVRQPEDVQAKSTLQINGVRRLTPLETERLQGFDDYWTLWGLNEAGERVEQSDTARYRQCGNAVAVPVVEWVGRQIVLNLSDTHRK